MIGILLAYGLIHEQEATVFGPPLRSKSATRGTHGEGEPMPERRNEVMPEPDGILNLVGVSPHVFTIMTNPGRKDDR